MTDTCDSLYSLYFIQPIPKATLSAFADSGAKKNSPHMNVTDSAICKNYLDLINDPEGQG